MAYAADGLPAVCGRSWQAVMAYAADGLPAVCGRSWQAVMAVRTAS